MWPSRFPLCSSCCCCVTFQTAKRAVRCRLYKCLEIHSYFCSYIILLLSIIFPELWSFKQTERKAAISEVFLWIIIGCVRRSVVTSASGQVARQERWIISHHPCGPCFKRSLYVLVLIAHKQMHLQLQVLKSHLFEFLLRFIYSYKNTVNAPHRPVPTMHWSCMKFTLN